MFLSELRIDGLRLLRQVKLSGCAKFNYFSGANGAGKTSILEALYLLSHPQSFRPGSWRAIINHDREAFTVFAEINVRNGKKRLGLERAREHWSAQVNGKSVERLSHFVSESAVVCFEPNIHALVTGSAHMRREFLDWGVFHVEHSFLPAWQRYKRALKQRNKLLKTRPTQLHVLLEPWENELDRTSIQIDHVRSAYLQKLKLHVVHYSRLLLPELGPPLIDYYRGWSQTQTLQAILVGNRERDIKRGFTHTGPQRADWRLTFDKALYATDLSRGQQKLAALICVLAQAHLYFDLLGEWPLLCFDDLRSELDHTHYQRVQSELQKHQAQVFVTSLYDESPDAEHRVFHVEHGQVSAA